VETTKRARQKANRAKKIETIQKQEKQDQRKQYAIMAAVLVVGVLGVLYLLSLGGDDETATDTTAEVDTTEPADADTATTADPAFAPAAVSTPTPGATSTGTPECPPDDGSAERTTTFAEAPPTCIEDGVTYTAEVKTTLGSFTIELDQEAAPVSVNNFVFLARYHYYEGTPFHRIIKDFVIQGGDAGSDPPTPGYTIDEEPPVPDEQGNAYQLGSVAMAKTPAPSSTGGQFFVVTGPNGEALPPEYSAIGSVTEGMDVVKAIEALPTNGGDFPTEEIYIESVTITEG
jgi:cyclophilin family peptidyl-prolyl cis-trans isomerase